MALHDGYGSMPSGALALVHEEPKNMTSVTWKDGNEYVLVCPTPYDISTENKEHCPFILPDGQVCNAGPFWPSQLNFHARAHAPAGERNEFALTKKMPSIYLCPEETCKHHKLEGAFKEARSLRNHYQQHHVPADQHQYTCEECQKVFSTPSHLRKHMKVHAEGQYVCMCGAKCKSKSRLQSHVASQSKYGGTHGFGYAIIDGVVTWKDGLKYLLVKPSTIEVDMVQKELCQFVLPDGQVCGAGPFWPSQLGFHMRAHTSGMSDHQKRAEDSSKKLPALFICPDDNCKHSRIDSAFKQARSLKNHFHQHHVPIEQHSYVCEDCHKAFSTASHLKKHQKIHGEGQYVCVCGAKCKSKSRLEKHISSQTKYGGQHAFASVPESARAATKRKADQPPDDEPSSTMANTSVMHGYGQDPHMLHAGMMLPPAMQMQPGMHMMPHGMIMHQPLSAGMMMPSMGALPPHLQHMQAASMHGHQQTA
eukprot:jgi/Chlat1/3087/Chrsp21S08797